MSFLKNGLIALGALGFISAVSASTANAAPISPVSVTVLSGTHLSHAHNIPSAIIDGVIDFDEWVSFRLSGGDGVLRFDLGADYDVSGVTIWNNGGFIEGDTEGVSVFDLALLSASESVVGSGTFFPADILAAQSFAVLGSTVRFIDMTVLASHGASYSLFHEIQFDAVLSAVPAPGALLLLGFGLLGFGMRRRTA